jgi:hypothetical protein
VIFEQLGIDVFRDEEGYWKSGSKLIFSVIGFVGSVFRCGGGNVKINGSNFM